MLCCARAIWDGSSSARKYGRRCRAVAVNVCHGARQPREEDEFLAIDRLTNVLENSAGTPLVK
jgi:predicted RNA polymerase sigma factor